VACLLIRFYVNTFWATNLKDGSAGSWDEGAVGKSNRRPEKSNKYIIMRLARK